MIRDVRMTSWLLVLSSVLFLVTCSDPRMPSRSTTTTSPASESGPPRASQEAEKSTASIANEPLPEFDTSLPSWVLELLQRPFAGDLDDMVKRRVIRAGVAFNRTNYFVDHGTQRGVMFAYLNQFETMLNTKLRKGNLRVHVIFVPLARDKLLPALTEGRQAASLTTMPTPFRSILVSSWSHMPLREIEIIRLIGRAFSAATSMSSWYSPGPMMWHLLFGATITSNASDVS